MPKKEQIKDGVEMILNSHKDELQNLMNDGYRIVITLIKDEPFRVDVTRQIDTSGRNSRIRITHDGISEDFSSIDALLYVVNAIGCQTFYENQGRSVIVSRDRPENLRENLIHEISNDNETWYVNLNSGIDQRVAKLNSIFKQLRIDWSAERV